MKRFLHAGEGYALFQGSSLEAIPCSTDTTLSENIRYINKTTSKAYGSLVRPWFRKAASLMLVALVCLKTRLSSCNLFSICTSCIYLGLFFMCLQAAIAKEPAPETDRAVLVADSNIHASQQEIPRISVGQSVPEEFWTTPFTFYDYEGVYTQTLEEYKGKHIIMGFWSIYCGTCIWSFPILKEARDTHHGKLVVLPVNSYDPNLKTVDKVMGRFSENHRLTGVVFDEYLKQLFPHTAVPHYIWIRPNGLVEAITIKAFLTPEHIYSFVEGSTNE